MAEKALSLADKLTAAGLKKPRVKSSDIEVNKKLRVFKLTLITTRFGECVLVEFEKFTFILPKRYGKVITEEHVQLVNSNSSVLYMTVQGFDEFGGHSSPRIKFQSEEEEGEISA